MCNCVLRTTSGGERTLIRLHMCNAQSQPYLPYTAALQSFASMFTWRFCTICPAKWSLMSDTGQSAVEDASSALSFYHGAMNAIINVLRQYCCNSKDEPMTAGGDHSSEAAVWRFTWPCMLLASWSTHYIYCQAPFLSSCIFHT